MRIKILVVCLIIFTAIAQGQVVKPDSNNVKFKSVKANKDTVVYDTLKAIPVPEFINNAISKHTMQRQSIDFSDYIYSGNWTTLLPFGYMQNLGVLGSPNEISVYAKGNGKNAIMIDGLDFSDRTGVGFDLYEIRSEIIDSVELLSPINSFMGSQLNNSAGLNFVTKDKLAIVPLTRIRYYQAPNEEGYIDGQFNLYPAKRLNLSAGVTNSSVNSDYTNSEYGSWKASIKARYLFSNKLNFVLDYYYTNINAQLNGGVNYDKILSSNSTAKANEVLYSSIEAPVLFSDRYQKITNNKIVFKSLINLFNKQPLVFSLYYFSNLKEFRQNESRVSNEYKYIIDNNRTKTMGGKVSQEFNLFGFNWAVNGVYENVNYNLHILNAEGNFTNSWLSVSASKTYSDYLKQSFYGKYSSYIKNRNLSGGTEIELTIAKGLNIVAGYSILGKPLSFIHSAYLRGKKIYESNYTLSFNAQSSIGFLSLKYFKSKNTNDVWNVNEYDSLITNSVAGAKYVSVNTSGVNLYAKLKAYNIELEFNGSYYLQKNDYNVYRLPEWTVRSGLYYVDTLFNKNLKMKFGFNFYAQGKQSFRAYDFEKMLTSYLTFDKNGNINSFGKNTEPAYQIDLFFAGKIRDRAIAYFVLENLTDNKYFIVPYYPMKGISFRFGVAWELYN